MNKLVKTVRYGDALCWERHPRCIPRSDVMLHTVAYWAILAPRDRTRGGFLRSIVGYSSSLGFMHDKGISYHIHACSCLCNVCIA